MAFIDTPRFPDTLALGAIGGPMYRTEIVGKSDGSEQRNRAFRHPRWVFEVGLVHKDAEETKTLLSFFRAVAAGRKNSFRFRDPTPDQAVGHDEILGTGDGMTRIYQLLKRYTYGAHFYDRPIYKPVLDTIAPLEVDGTPLDDADWSIDDQGQITLLLPLDPDAVLVAPYYEFDIAMRFDTDRLPIQRLDLNVYSWESIKLWEERFQPVAPGQPEVEHWELVISGVNP